MNSHSQNNKNLEKSLFTLKDFLENEEKEFKQFSKKMKYLPLIIIFQNILINILLILIDENFTNNEIFSYFNKINISYNTLIILISIFIYIFINHNIFEFTKENSIIASLSSKIFIWFVEIKTIIDQNLHIFSYLFNSINKENKIFDSKRNVNDFFQLNLFLLGSMKFILWQFLINTTGENRYFYKLYKISYFWKIIFISSIIYNLINLIYTIFYFRIGVFNFFLILSENLTFLYFLYCQSSNNTKKWKTKKNSKENLEFLININNFFKQILENNNIGIVFNLISKYHYDNDYNHLQLRKIIVDQEEIFNHNKNVISNRINLDDINSNFLKYETQDFFEKFALDEKIDKFIEFIKYEKEYNYIKTLNFDVLNELENSRNLDESKSFDDNLKNNENLEDGNTQIDKDYFLKSELLRSNSQEFRKHNNYSIGLKNREINRKIPSTDINNYRIKLNNDYIFPPEKMNKSLEKKTRSILFKKESPKKINFKVFKSSKMINNNIIDESKYNVQSSNKNSDNFYSRSLSKFCNFSENRSLNNNNLEIKEENGDSYISSEFCDDNNNRDIMNEEQFYNDMENDQKKIYNYNKTKSFAQSKSLCNISSLDEHVVNLENFIPNSDLSIKKGIDKYFLLNDCNKKTEDTCEFSTGKQNNNNIILYKNSFGNEEINKYRKQPRSLIIEHDLNKLKTVNYNKEHNLIKKPTISSRKKPNSILKNPNYKQTLLSTGYQGIQRASSYSKIEKKFINIEDFLVNQKLKNRTKSNFETGKFQELSIKDSEIKYKNEKGKFNFNNLEDKELKKKYFNTDINNQNKNSILNNYEKNGKQHIKEKILLNFQRITNIMHPEKPNFLQASEIKNMNYNFKIDFLKNYLRNNEIFQQTKESLYISLKQLIQKTNEVGKGIAFSYRYYISLPQNLFSSLKNLFKINLTQLNHEYREINKAKNELNTNFSLENDVNNLKEKENVTNEFFLTLRRQSQYNFLEPKNKSDYGKKHEQTNIKNKDSQPINLDSDNLFQITNDLILDKKIKNLFKNIKQSSTFDKYIEFNNFMETLNNILLEHEFENLIEIGPFLISEKINNGSNLNPEKDSKIEDTPNYKLSIDKEENFFIKFDLKKISFKRTQVKFLKNNDINQRKNKANIVSELNITLQSLKNHTILEDQNKSISNLISKKQYIKSSNNLPKTNDLKGKKNNILMVIKKIENINKFIINKFLQEDIGNLNSYDMLFKQIIKLSDLKKRTNDQILIEPEKKYENPFSQEKMKLLRTSKTFGGSKIENNNYMKSLTHRSNRSRVITNDNYSFPLEKYNSKNINNFGKSPTFYNLNNREDQPANSHLNQIDNDNPLCFRLSSSIIEKNNENFQNINIDKSIYDKITPRIYLRESDIGNIEQPRENILNNHNSTFILDNNIITNNINSYIFDNRNTVKRKSYKSVNKFDFNKSNILNYNNNYNNEKINEASYYNVLIHKSENFLEDVKTLKTMNNKSETPTHMQHSSKLNLNYNSTLMVEKLSALLHDFKHIVYDNIIYFDYLISKYLKPEQFEKSNQSVKQSCIDSEFESHRIRECEPNFSNNMTDSINTKGKKNEYNYYIVNDECKDLKDTSNIKKNIHFQSSEIDSDIEKINLPKKVLNEENKFQSLFYDSTYRNDAKIAQQQNLILQTRKGMLKDELVYLDVMKEYTISLVLNITNFISDNDFLPAKFEKVDFKRLIDLMVKIFERRLDYENSIICENSKYSISNNKFNNISNKKSKNIQIKSFIKDSENKLYKELYSNQNLLISLFYNLLSNSFKYTNQGEIIIESFIEEINNNGNIIVKISDTGAGIPDEILKNWGKPFNFKDKTKGTGLGQFLINMISSKLGLKISKPQKNYSSSTKNGTIIEICIPIKDDYSMQDRNGMFLSKWNLSSDKSILNSISNMLVNQNFNKNNTNNIDGKGNMTTPNTSDILKIDLSLRGSSNNINISDLRNVIDLRKKTSKQVNFSNFESIKDNQNINYESGNEEKTVSYSNKSYLFDYKKIMEHPNLNIFVPNDLEEDSQFNEPNICEDASINYTINKIESNDRIIHIMCLDDDQLFLSMLNSNLIKFANENPEFTFEFIYVTNFKDFFIEYIKYLYKGIRIDFFLFDQNISDNLTGYDISNIVNYINKSYFKENFKINNHNYIFITEDMQLLKFKSKQKNSENVNIEINRKNIFSKMQFKDICRRIKEILLL